MGGLFLGFLTLIGRIYSNNYNLLTQYSAFLALSVVALFVVFLAVKIPLLKKKFLEGIDLLTIVFLTLILVFSASALFSGFHGCSQGGDCTPQLEGAREIMEAGESDHGSEYGALVITSMLFSFFGIDYFLPAFASSFFGLVTVLLAFIVGKTLKDNHLGLISAFIFASSEFLIVWSKDIELYSATITFLMFAILSFLLYFEEESDVWILGLGVISTTFAMMIRIEAIFFLPVLFFYSFMGRKEIRRHHISVFLLILLAVPTLMGSIHTQYLIYSGGDDIVAAEGFNMVTETMENIPRFLLEVMTEFNSYLVSGLFLIGLSWSFKRRKSSQMFFAIFFLIFFLFSTFAITLLLEYGYGDNIAYSRSLLPLQIPLLMLSSLGLNRVLEWMEQSLGKDLDKMFYFLAVPLAVLLLMTQPSLSTQSTPQYAEMVKYSQELPRGCKILAGRSQVVEVHRDMDVIQLGEVKNRSRLESIVQDNNCVILSYDRLCKVEKPGPTGYENCNWVMDTWDTEPLKEFSNGYGYYRIKSD